MRGVLFALALIVTMTASAGPAPARVLEFGELEGWDKDDHLAALNVFRDTCSLIEGEDWSPPCRLAWDIPDTREAARAFFELLFRPVLVGAPPALFTGYFEPELDGSLTRTPRFTVPLYRRPPELQDGVQYLSREMIDRGALRGRGLEIAWLEDPVEAYFLQVQGSGRIRLGNGQVIRLGYAGRNGHGYRSIGQEMIRRGTHRMEDVSAQEIRAWVRANPVAGAQLLHTNPSYIFFRRLPDLPPDKGPIGAMARSITTLRSVAVDPAFVPLGAPVWIEKDGRAPLRRLMVAQDTGGAIKGAQRADIFFGTGRAAGETAGTVRDGGRLIQLWPIDRAFALIPGG